MTTSETNNLGRSLAERIAGLSSEQRALRQRQASARRPGFEIVAESLRKCGVTHIYGVAGGPTEEILPACLKENIRAIGVYHQSSAVLMSLAHNFQSGRLVSATLVSAGPASTNAITGLLVARDNGWPALVIGGQRSSFQTLAAVQLVKHITKYAVEVRSAGDIPDAVREAHKAAVTGRPGPVYLDLHEDALRGRAVVGSTEMEGTSTTHRGAPSVSDDEITRIASSLLSARRPALLFGKGVRWTVVPTQLRELVERLSLPFITSPMARGFIPEDHPLCANQARAVLQAQADAVLVLGARMNWVFRHGAQLSRHAEIFRIDIETSEEDDTAVRPELIHGDAGDFVARLLGHVEARHDTVSDATRRHRLSAWHKTLGTASSENRSLLDDRMNADCRPMSPHRMMKEVRDALPREAICITDGNISMAAAQQVIPAFLPGSRMDAGTNGCMGVGIPFAIGAKVACPHRPVVAVTGDYAFSLSAMELEVCTRQGIPIVVVVANNQGNNGASKQKRLFLEHDAEAITMSQPGLEYDRIMKLFGGQGATVSDPDSLKPTLVGAIEAGTPFCINVVVDPYAPIVLGWGEQDSMSGARAE